MKVGIISQARIGSTRLPGKVLKSIRSIPLLQYHINRLTESNIPVYIATSSLESDDAIQKYCNERGISVFRGSENDVLSRYYHCAKYFNLDVVVRVTSDCPLIDGLLIERSIKEFLDLKNDAIYMSNVIERTFPRGLDFEIFSIRLLEKTHYEATLATDREHVTPYLRRELVKPENLRHILYLEDKSNYRITVDTQEDFRLVKELIETKEAHHLSAKGIIQILDNNINLTELNSHIEQKKYGQ